MPPPAPPSRPFFFGVTSSERARSRGPDYFRLDWSPVADTVAYDLSVNGVLVADAVPGGTVTGLTPNSPQSVAVRARNADGASDFSDQLDRFTRPPTPDRPRFVPNIAAARGPTEFRVTWPPVAGVPVYDARLDGVTVPGSPADFPGGAEPEFVLGGLPPNTPHTVRIRARDDSRGGASFFSAALSDFTRPPTPTVPRPAGDPETARDADRLLIDWDLVADQDQFGYEYDILVDDAEDVHFPEQPVVRNRTRGTTIDVLDASLRLAPNVRYLIRVRARDDDRGRDSLWSPTFTTATRPPRPVGFGQLPVGLPGAGPVLGWAAFVPFHLDVAARVELTRSVLGGVPVPLSGPLLAEGRVFFDGFSPRLRREYVAIVVVALPHYGPNASHPTGVVAIVHDFRAGAAGVTGRSGVAVVIRARGGTDAAGE